MSCRRGYVPQSLHFCCCRCSVAPIRTWEVFSTARAVADTRLEGKLLLLTRVLEKDCPFLPRRHGCLFLFLFFVLVSILCFVEGAGKGDFKTCFMKSSCTQRLLLLLVNCPHSLSNQTTPPPRPPPGRAPPCFASPS